MGLLRQPLTMKRHDKNTTEGGEEERGRERGREKRDGREERERKKEVFQLMWCGVQQSHEGNKRMRQLKANLNSIYFTELFQRV